MKTTTTAFIASACAAAFLVAPAAADLLQFTQTGSGSGTLDGVAFDDTTFTITALTDTANVDGIAPFSSWTPHLSATIEIDGVGTFDILTQTYTLVEHPGQWGAPAVAFAIEWIGGPAGLFWGPMDAVFGTWDTTTELDTVTGDSFHLGWGLKEFDPQIFTTGGLLYFNNSQEFVEGTFTATLVPAPGALVLLAGAGLIRRRRREAAT